MNAFSSIVRRGHLAYKRRYFARGLILIYHRIAEDPVDPWRLCVSPANFARQLEIIRTLGFQPVWMSSLADALRERRLPRRTIAVTIDDGYRDNLDAARPILERYQTPATHFATAGYIGSGEPFWWDVLDQVLLHPGRLPNVLEITLAGEQHRWELGDDAVLEAGKEVSWPEWRPFQPPPTRRHAVHDALWPLLASALPDDRQSVVRELLDLADAPTLRSASARPMTEDELRALRGDGLVEIGAHSLTHPALSALPAPMQAHELRESKARLERILGTEVRGCSYPQGRSSPEVQRAARAAGYDWACGSLPDAVGRRSNLFHLPRVSVRNWGEARFKTLLAHYIVH
jgi:peptidoglycan/xylan/chitin deacetylase (PgdA/CDA1 family)